MKTPITDAAAEMAGEFCGDSEVVNAPVARRLELDRAALMEVLERIRKFTSDRWVIETAEDAIDAARANFPEQSDAASH